MAGEREIGITSRSVAFKTTTTFKLMNGWTFFVPDQNGSTVFKYTLTKEDVHLTIPVEQIKTTYDAIHPLIYRQDKDCTLIFNEPINAVLSIMDYSMPGVIPDKLYFFTYRWMDYWVYTKKDAYTVIVVPELTFSLA